MDENEEFETRELTQIYKRRGLDKDLAHQVAVQLMKHDALAAHARDELGISETVKPRPLQAGLASAATFAVGALLPLLAVALAPASRIALSVTATSLLALTGLGILSARVGGAPIWTATARIVFWGALAMAITAVVGRWFGTVL